MKLRWTKSFLWLALMTACGVEIGNPKNPTTGTNPTPQNIIADDASATELLTSGLETALAAATERFNEDEANLALTFAVPVPTEECTEDGARKVTYSRTLKGTIEREVGRPLFARIHAITLDDTFSVNWTADADVLSCTATKRPKAVFGAGANLALTLNYEKNRSSSVRLKRTDEIRRQSEAKVTGTRTIQFEPVLENGTMTGLNEEIAEKHERTMTFSSAAGTKTLQGTFATKEGAPLKVTFQGKPANWTEKKIASGVMTLTTPEGLYGEITWQDVTITKAEGCLPTSGTLSGAFYESKDATTPLRTFTVTYGESAGLTAAFEDGAKLTLYPEACEAE